MTTLFSMQEFSTMQTDNVEAFQSLSNAVLEAGYKITLLNFEVARNSLNQGAATYAQIAGNEAPATPYQPLAKETATYLKTLAHISAEAQVEIARLLQAHMSEFGKNTISLLDRASKTDSNVGTLMATAAMKSALATAAASCQGLTETTRRVTEMAEANANALAETVQSISTQQAGPGKAHKKAA